MGTADVVVIGGGIVGVCIAYHLAQKGPCRVVVVERRDMLGSGTTSKSGGGLRKQFSLPVNIRLAMYSQDFYAQLDEAFDNSLDLRRHGYLLLAASEAHKVFLLRNIETQKAQGVTDSGYVETKDIQRIAPDLWVEDIVGGAYCPSDGYLSPDGALYAIAKASKELGVSFWTGEEVLRIGRERGRVSDVATTTRTVSTRIIVNAGGPHAGEISGMVGVDLPIQPLRRNLFLLGPAARPAVEYPMVLDLKSGFSARHEPEGILIGGGDRDEPPHLHFSAEPDMEYFAHICPKLIARIPALDTAGLLRASAGTDGYTRDGSAIVGAVDGVPGFYVAAGFCGHGVMQAPAVGKALSELILDGAASTDISGLRLARFDSPSGLPFEGMVMAHHEE